MTIYIENVDKGYRKAPTINKRFGQLMGYGDLNGYRINILGKKTPKV